LLPAALLLRFQLRQYPRLLPMLVLFDHSVPAPLVPYLVGHTVTEARNRGWDTLSNGDLLAEAERAGFEVFLTADKNIRYQQNLGGRRIAVVVLSTPQWPVVRLHTAKIAAAVNAAAPGSYAEVQIPHKS
jgi:hypothetical protein